MEGEDPIRPPFVLPSSARQGLPRPSRLLKLAFDLVIAGLGVALLAFPFAVIALLICLDSPGPAFYAQVRSGEGRRRFRIFKFRTMVMDAEARLPEVLQLNMHADPRLYKIRSDPRVTRFGAVLRRYSLDELPQLFNILRGDMSLVGPRPLTLMEDQYVQGWACLRTTVKPGITGPWQVAGRNELPFEEMMRLDCLYVVNWSFLGDLALLAQTLPAVLKAEQNC